jgi:23S rRNA (guanosine2251-2'-O)-methyltransferase
VGELARRRGVAIEPATREQLDELVGVGSRHQGVVAIAGDYRYADADQLIARAAAGPGPALLVALDCVKDPHNLGAIARTAYLAGAHGLLLPRDRAAGITATATKVSAGATEHLAIAQVTNLARAVEAAKAAGLWTVAVAAGAGAMPVWRLDGCLPLCLVVGEEGRGIGRGRLVQRVGGHRHGVVRDRPPAGREARGSAGPGVKTSR